MNQIVFKKYTFATILYIPCRPHCQCRASQLSRAESAENCHFSAFRETVGFPLRRAAVKVVISTHLHIWSGQMLGCISVKQFKFRPPLQ